MVKTYQEVNQEHHEREREEHHDRKHRKYTLLIIVALLVAFVGIMLAQNAQDTADINNVFEIAVNNTNLAPTVAGHPPGTGERVSGTTYWANNSPIEIFVFAHAQAVGDNAERVRKEGRTEDSTRDSTEERLEALDGLYPRKVH